MSDEEKFMHGDRVVTRSELQREIEAEAAREPSENWRLGEFNFNDWLIESLQVGLLTRVDGDEADDSESENSDVDETGESAVATLPQTHFGPREQWLRDAYADYRPGDDKWRPPIDMYDEW